MSVFQAVVLGFIVLAGLYGILIYNSLVQVKHNISKAWANIEVLLRQRHDELPKLVETCKQYRQFEAETLARVTEARERVSSARERRNIPALGVAEQTLRNGVGQLFAVAEAYPELQSNENFMQLQSRITALENGIADRREWYNEAVNIYNVRINQFPDLLAAYLMDAQELPLLKFSAAEKTDPGVQALGGD
jgi:LemA protein